MKKNYLIAIVIILVVVVAAIAVSYYSILSGTTERETIKIGYINIMSGSFARYGWSMKIAVDMITDEVNSEGGLLVGGKRYPVEIIIGDTEAKPEAAIAVFRKLIEQDKVVALAGGVVSSAIIAAMELSEDAGVPYVNTGGMGIDIVEKIKTYHNAKGKSYTFQLSQTFADSALTDASCAQNYFEPDTIAFISKDDDIGYFWVDEIQAWFEAHAPHVETVYAGHYPSTQTDFTTEIFLATEANPDVLFAFTVGAGTLGFIETLWETGWQGDIIGRGDLGDTDIWAQASDMLEGYLLNLLWDWSANTTEISWPFVEEYKTRYGIEPWYLSAQMYDSMLCLFDSIERAGSLDKDAIQNALETGEWLGVRGPFSFSSGETGHVAPMEQVIMQAQNGERVPVWPLSISEGVIPRKQLLP
jgi:branched-chain amino acid transport system substrate-binding protein